MLELYKFLIISPTIWTEKAVMVYLMQNDGKTGNRKTMIAVSLDNFCTPSESRMFIF